MNTRILNGTWRVLVALVFSLSFIGIPTGRVSAGSTFVVNSLAEGSDASLADGICDMGGGLCTLRAAIQQANYNLGADTINFDLGGTITLESSLPDIVDALTIDGIGQTITISGADTYRVMWVNMVNVTLNKLSINNGKAPAGVDGGGVFNYFGNVTVTNSNFSGNNALNGGAIKNYAGTMTVVASTFSYNTASSSGGAIFVRAGTVTISTSNFSGNYSAENGGAIISQDATLTVANSTFWGNASKYSGGGIHAFQDTGTSTLTVLNSTFSGNGATFTSGLGETLYNGTGSLHLKNTILANSSTGWDCYSETASSDYANNLFPDGQGCGTPVSSADPMLDLPAYNGGPTQSFALLPGSPAINAGDEATCAAAPVNNLDQRGVTRPSGAHCDIGSYEYVNDAPTDISLSNSSVSENRPIGTEVGILTTTDPNGGTTHTYSFACTTSGADDTSFQISGDSLQTKAVFDRETKNSYAICIRTDDGYGGTYDKNFNISVTDILEGTSTFRSVGAYDGHIFESGENSNAGGTVNATSTTFNLGDEVGDKQYRAVLSFNTASLPDTAVITKVTLKIKRPVTGFLVGNNSPFSWGMGLKVDVCRNFFGTTAALQLGDFNFTNATNCKVLIGAFGGAPVASWYSANILSTAFTRINRIGTTQFRLRFAKDDNDDGAADYMKFYSGNYATATARPTLVIGYYVP